MKLPPNHVVFQVSPEMTKLDVKNYLEKIYKVPVYNVMTRNVTGEVKKPGFLDPDFDITPLYKEDDIKYAYVTLVSYFSILCCLRLILIFAVQRLKI